MKKDNIEEVYSELGAFSKEPPKELWGQIESRLHPKKKRRGIIWFWGSAAAILVLLLGYIMTDDLMPNNKSDIKVTDVEHAADDNAIDESETQTTKIDNTTVADDIKDGTVPKVADIEENSSIHNENQKQQSNSSELLKKNQKEHQTSKSIYDKKSYKKDEVASHNKSYAQNIEKETNDKANNKEHPNLQKNNERLVQSDKDKVIASNDSISKNNEKPALDLAKELMAAAEDLSDSTSIEIIPSAKWSLEVLGGLSNMTSKGSIENTSVNTATQNDFIYALKVGYAISDRWMVKSGVGKNVLGQEINNVLYATSDVSLSENNGSVLVNNETISFLFSPGLANDFSTFEPGVDEGTLEQQLNYVQVPLEFSYALLKEQKYTVSLGVGGNVNFLTDNRAFLNGNQIGESLGVDSTIFGATINSNISYEFTKKMNLFLEPSYNYFEKPINTNNQNFKNAQFRALFGLQYRF
ncbi:hypothetical protein [Winogradskyella flava]|uniref:hypothetical protein n=1 Tax=Winogradskyella flava TaxID=1884876 RepID=UPI002492D995|nr:hypothetical protein [Winogradskyella flava]